MPKYGISSRGFTTAATIKQQLGIFPNATGENAEVVELIMTGSGSSAPADRSHRASAASCTFATTGVSTSLTPEPFNSSATAAKSSCGSDYATTATAFTTAACQVEFGFNQRGGMRWAVSQGEGIKLHNANTNKGIVWNVISDAAGATDATAHFWEDN